jgi:hypothetical protein
MWWSQKGFGWQYGGALHAGLVRLHARNHTPALVHPDTHTRTHARSPMCLSPSLQTHTHTHTETHIALHGNNGFVNTPRCYVIRALPVILISPVYNFNSWATFHAFVHSTYYPTYRTYKKTQSRMRTPILNINPNTF